MGEPDPSGSSGVPQYHKALFDPKLACGTPHPSVNGFGLLWGMGVISQAFWARWLPGLRVILWRWAQLQGNLHAAAEGQVHQPGEGDLSWASIASTLCLSHHTAFCPTAQIRNPRLIFDISFCYIMSLVKFSWICSRNSFQKFLLWLLLEFREPLFS